MGMDVSGRNATCPAGEYFRASIWSWRPILSVMQKAGVVVPLSWHNNDGEGPRTQKECDAIADKLEAFLAKTSAVAFELPKPRGMVGVNEQGIFGAGDLSPYAVQRDHLEQFILFLRNCGGFRIF